jgi:hypothetical protein
MIAFVILNSSAIFLFLLEFKAPKPDGAVFVVAGVFPVPCHPAEFHVAAAIAVSAHEFAAHSIVRACLFVGKFALGHWNQNPSS